MSGYRVGDQTVVIAGVETRLRLTVSALAKITVGLGADSPATLSDRLRHMSVEDWNLVCRALSSPRPTAGLSKVELTEIMPKISAVIADGFAP